jgi:hypothetical protein
VSYPPKEILFWFIVEVLVLKLKHRRSTKGMSHLEWTLLFPVFRLKAITMKQTESKPSKEYCKWL